MRDASTIQYSGFKKLRSGYLHPSSLVTPSELAILNENVEQRRDENKSASSNARGNLNSCHDSPCWGEQNAGLEQTRTEVIPSLLGEQNAGLEPEADGSHMDGIQASGRNRTSSKVAHIRGADSPDLLLRGCPSQYRADRVTHRVATL